MTLVCYSSSWLTKRCRWHCFIYLYYLIVSFICLFAFIQTYNIHTYSTYRHTVNNTKWHLNDHLLTCANFTFPHSLVAGTRQLLDKILDNRSTFKTNLTKTEYWNSNELYQSKWPPAQTSPFSILQWHDTTVSWKGIG